MSVIDNIRKFINDEAQKFGAKLNTEFNKPYIERNNTSHDALKDNGAYFGFIHPEEENSGPFHDFSLTIFPNEQSKPWLVCLGIGSQGFKNDYELSTFPGLRRIFSQLVDQRGFCKSDFSDIETNLPKSITMNQDLAHIKNTIKTYSKVLPVCQIVDDPESEIGKKIISAFLAGYAKLRDWPTNNSHRKAVTNALIPFSKKLEINYEKDVLNLINNRKFVILQGPPGTGKTRLAKIISNKLKAKSFFTQFHAETTYSDFIYGLRPDTSSSVLKYKANNGIFIESINHCIETAEKTILIIDEINRANLSNVLGQIFYLFEYKQDNSNIQIELTPDLSISKLPDNFFVIATMNTADRSLAVVDFALRRRFAWYSLTPRSISSQLFHKQDFDKFNEIFRWYASSNELTLQPGQGYFLANSEEEMLMRIKFELFPLIKEYLNEGLLKSAKEEFNNYFMNRIGETLFE